MILELTKKESDLFSCACMILKDQCPPDHKCYLCAQKEDIAPYDCYLCWYEYMEGVAEGTIKLQRKGGRVVAT